MEQLKDDIERLKGELERRRYNVRENNLKQYKYRTQERMARAMSEMAEGIAQFYTTAREQCELEDVQLLRQADEMAIMIFNKEKDLLELQNAHVTDDDEEEPEDLTLKYQRLCLKGIYNKKKSNSRESLL